MLSHGKHVLCESSLCINSKQVLRLIRFAEEKKRIISQVVWPRFSPVYEYVCQQLESEVLGEIQGIDMEYGIKLDSFRCL